MGFRARLGAQQSSAEDVTERLQLATVELPGQLVQQLRQELRSRGAAVLALAEELEGEESEE